MRPESGVSAPAITRASSVRPAPSSPATPSTSPRCSVKLTSRRRAPRLTPSTRRISAPLRPRRRRVMLGDVPIRHHSDELGNRRRQRSRADEAAVAQNRRPMSDPGQLLQPVGNVDDGAPFAGESADGGKQLFDLRGRQRRGRLVHDQDSRTQRERLRDFDHLLLSHAQSGDGRFRVDDGPERLQQRARPFDERAAIDDPGANTSARARDRCSRRPTAAERG